jgi:hypothetical protein
LYFLKQTKNDSEFHMRTIYLYVMELMRLGEGTKKCGFKLKMQKNQIINLKLEQDGDKKCFHRKNEMVLYGYKVKYKF